MAATSPAAKQNETWRNPRERTLPLLPITIDACSTQTESTHHEDLDQTQSIDLL
jgi:hypothetical protein